MTTGAKIVARFARTKAQVGEHGGQDHGCGLLGAVRCNGRAGRNGSGRDARDVRASVVPLLGLVASPRPHSATRSFHPRHANAVPQGELLGYCNWTHPRLRCWLLSSVRMHRPTTYGNYTHSIGKFPLFWQSFVQMCKTKIYTLTSFKAHSL